jgi:hypothetical protein
LINPKTGKRWKVFMSLPSNGTVCDFQNYMLRDIEKRYADEIELVYPEQLCQRIFHDAARNGIVEDFLATDCDVMWSIDSDIVPPRHVLDLLTMHGDKWQVAGAPYPIFMAQPGEAQRQIVVTAYKAIAPHPESGKPRLAPCGVPEEGAEFVDGLATGCLMVKREVFEKLEKPYFEFKYDAETRQPIEGEDIGFCLKMHKLGIKFFTDYSMVCKHYKNSLDLLELRNYARLVAHSHVEQLRGSYQAELDKAKKQMEEVAVRFQKVVNENKQLKAQLSSMPQVNKAGLVGRDGKPLIYR